MEFAWRQSGKYGECQCHGDAHAFSVELVECVLQSEADNLTYSVDGSDCGFELKPFGKFEECGDSVVAECSASVCGNAVKEGANDCEPAISFEDDCCLSDCTPDDIAYVDRYRVELV